MKTKRFSRIMGFIVALLFLMIFSVVVIGSQFQNFKKHGFPYELIIPAILVLICIIALVFSFKNPKLSGWILMSAGLVWVPYMLIMYGTGDAGALLFGLAFILSGVLFLPWAKN